jgi:hypothetical protein
MSGHWPPEWEDPDDGHSDAGLPDGPHLDAGHPELDLSEVTSFLASVPGPALPPSFEARISAAIAAEAAARATTTRAEATEPAGPPIAVAGADDEKTAVRSGNQKEFSPVAAAGDPATSTNRRPRRTSRASRRAAEASRPGHSRPDGRRRRLRMPSAEASGWLVVCCLVIAGFGFLFTHASGSSSSSSADSASAGAAVPAATSGAKGAHDQTNTQLGPEPASSASAAASGPTGFTVIESGTRYQRSTMADQVRRETNASVYGTEGGAVTPASSAPASAPSDEASPSAGSSSIHVSHVPSAALTGCVLQLTDGVTPSLVDQASYDGTPAYIIAVPSRVWVVRLGCTATDPQLIAQVPLTG